MIRSTWWKGIGLILVAAAGLGGSTLASAADWPQFRGPDRNGISVETGLIHSFPETGPAVLWRVSLGEGYSGVAIAENRLFTLFSDGDGEFVVGLDADSGKEVWRYRLGGRYTDSQGNGPRSTPTVENGIVYALGAQGKLAALRAESGEKVWALDLETAVKAKIPRWGVSTSPLVEGDLLIFDGGGAQGASVVAVDKGSGRTVWTSQDDKPGYSSPLAVTVGGVRQVVVLSGTQVVAVAPADGTLLWRQAWKTDWDVNAAMPVLVPPNKIFLSSGYDTGSALLQLGRTTDGFTVETVWESRGMKNQFSSSVLHAGHLYGLDNKILKCLDAADGSECWKARGFGHGSLIQADGMLIVLSDDGRLALVAADPSGYQELASAQVLEGRCWTAPSLAGGRLYLRNETELVALDLSR